MRGRERFWQFFPDQESKMGNPLISQTGKIPHSFMLYCFAPTSFAVVIEVSTVNIFVPVIVRYIDQAYN